MTLCEEPCSDYPACACAVAPPALPEHSEHGASSTDRWWNCPASVALSRTLPNEESEYAKEGTRAHALAALCLDWHQDATEYVGRHVLGVEVDAEMAEHVQVYLDQCRTVIKWTAKPTNYAIERRFDLSKFGPPAPMYGTADFVAWSAGTLYVIDLKYGQGVQVQAAGNPQLKYYALGAMLSLPDGVSVTNVKAMIVQPRAPGGPAIRSTDLDPLDLVEWSAELLQRAAATLEPDAPFVPGEWCTKSFCRARYDCKARRDAVVKVAGAEFVEVGWAGRKCDDCGGSGECEGDLGRLACKGCGGTGEAYDSSKRIVGLSDPRLLSPAEKSALLPAVEMLKKWASDFEAGAIADLSRGVEIPGWKIIPTRPSTDWRSEAEADAELASDLGDTRWAPRELLSYAQARDALAKKMPGKNADIRKAAAVAALADLVTTSSSGVKLVPDSDPTPSIPTAGTEFLD